MIGCHATDGDGPPQGGNVGEMRPWKVAVIAVATLVVTLAGTVQASHGGAEHRASGRGQGSHTTVQRTCFQFVFNPSTFAFGCATETVTETTATYDFDFDARLGAKHVDPHGRIRYEVTTRTVVTHERTAFGEANCPFLGGLCAPERTVSDTTTEEAVRADVTCLTVVQNRATIGGHVTRYTGNGTPTRGILLDVTDNTVARQQLAPDEFLATFVTDVPYACPPPNVVKPPITDGDVYVEQS